MSRRDEEQAREDNQLIVRAQHKMLGLPMPKQRRERPAQGLARIIVKASECRAYPTPEQLDKAVATHTKTLRKECAAKGYIVDSIETCKLLNGDVEIRALFTVKRSAD